MIVDERSYTLVPGTLKQWQALYEQEGLPVQQRILGNLLGFFVTEIGTLNTIVHWWGYENFAERERRRAQMAADPAWQAYLAKSAPYMQRMENRILTPLPFSPLK
ncbi:MAG: NIPSNAP family protein [Reyranellaceae bacterium]